MRLQTLCMQTFFTRILNLESGHHVENYLLEMQNYEEMKYTANNLVIIKHISFIKRFFLSCKLFGYSLFVWKQRLSSLFRDVSRSSLLPVLFRCDGYGVYR